MWKHLTCWFSLVSLVVLSAPFMSSCASYQEEEGHLAFAATAPFRVFNVGQEPIPGQLNALHQPYGYIDQSGCEAWTREINELDAAIEANAGRRVGYRRDSETFVGRTGNLRDQGVAALANTAVPFRGVVRQLSGAARYEQRAERASDRARYRIGYLVGLGRAHRCPGFGTLQPTHNYVPQHRATPQLSYDPYRTAPTPPHATSRPHGTGPR
ncbi:MAG: hypothetical protein AAFP97_04910 [Pseudomonadota bacterium]